MPVTTARARRRRLAGILAWPCSVLLIIGFVPPQLNRLTAGPLRPLEYFAFRPAANGWRMLADAGRRCAGGPVPDPRAIEEIERAIRYPIFALPPLHEWTPEGCPGFADVVAALDALQAAARQAVAAGRVPRAVELWEAQLKVSRNLIEHAQTERSVELGYRLEEAVCQQVRAAVNGLPANQRQADWEPLRGALRRAPSVSRLAFAWRLARWRVVYAREFEPETLPPHLALRGLGSWLRRLPANCFDDPYYTLTQYRTAVRLVTREAAKPRPERNLALLQLTLQPRPFELYDYGGRDVPSMALAGGNWPGFDGEDARLADRVLTDTMLCLRLARDRTGRLPSDLAELVEAGLVEEVPEDPFTVWRLAYDPTRRLLWSSGPDERDDGGIGTDGDCRPDLVVRLEFAAAGD